MKTITIFSALFLAAASACATEIDFSTYGFLPCGSTEVEQIQNICAINQKVDTEMASLSDRENYGKDDYWESEAPAGDCEDHQLTKLHLLLKSGWTPEQVKLVVVETKFLGPRPNRGIWKHEYHALLEISYGGYKWLLDNLTHRIRRADLVYGTNYRVAQIQLSGKLWQGGLPAGFVDYCNRHPDRVECN